MPVRAAFPLILAFLALSNPAAGGAPLTFKDCPTCPEMVRLEPEPFLMGYDRGKSAERPAHMVSLAGPYAIARTETTYDQWNACVGDGACTPPQHDRGWGEGDRPVIYIDYDQISAYLDWLSDKTGRRYRLPLEEEWEYAAHGGATNAGRQRVDGQGRANCNKCVPGWNHRTFPVASLPPNGFGLYDMLGNVMEWTASCWVPNYEPPQTPDCTRRVRRGGSWYFDRYVSTPTYRYGALPDRVSYDVGFRVAVTVD